MRSFAHVMLITMMITGIALVSATLRNSNKVKENGKDESNIDAHSISEMVSSRGRNLDLVITYEKVHDGHCASGWMGNNVWVETRLDCAKHCDARKRQGEDCGYFAFTDKFDNPYNCATYFRANDCPDDNRFPKYEAYQVTYNPVEFLEFDLVHDGHCASGWMGDNEGADTVDRCASLCDKRDGCGYFSFDATISQGRNCATYLEANGCPDDNKFPNMKSYKLNRILPPYSFLHEGHCASGWDGENKKAGSADECAVICSKRDKPGLECGYFAYNNIEKKCAFYFKSGGCVDDELFPDYRAYQLD